MKTTKPIFSLNSDGRMELVLETKHYDNDVLIATRAHRSVLDPSDHNYDQLISAAVDKIVPAVAIQQEKAIQTHEAQKIKDDKEISAEKETCKQHILKIEQLEKVIAEQERIIAEMTAPEVVE